MAPFVRYPRVILGVNFYHKEQLLIRLFKRRGKIFTNYYKEFAGPKLQSFYCVLLLDSRDSNRR